MKTKFKFIIFGALIYLMITSCKTNQISNSQTPTIDSNKRGDLRIMFYNCENLFDIYDDTLKLDDEFLPEGEKHWSYEKYQEKLAHISKVITAVGGWDPPEIIGLCEVENRYVLDGLVDYSALKKQNYQIIHQESPDNRGIDVALLYIKEKFKPLTWRAIPVVFPANMGKTTRDILYVKGVDLNQDTLHIFVNHWPSRWGGQMESEDKRMYVAELVRTKVDSIYLTNLNANIIIMGDLNDFPTDRSLLESLRTKTDFSNIESKELYNLSFYLQEVKGVYSHKYQGEGGVLDQMIISSPLLNSQNSISTTKDNAHVFSATFLLEEDTDNVGYKPFRTYIGYKYAGGFSDHLPVYFDLFFNN